MRRRRGRQGMSGDERVGELEQRVGPPGQAAVETSSEGAARLALGGVIGDAEDPAVSMPPPSGIGP